MQSIDVFLKVCTKLWKTEKSQGEKQKTFIVACQTLILKIHDNFYNWSLNVYLKMETRLLVEFHSHKICQSVSLVVSFVSQLWNCCSTEKKSEKMILPLQGFESQTKMGRE